MCNTWKKAVRSPGPNRGRAPPPHGAPRHAYRPRVDISVRRRRSERSIERTSLCLLAASPPSGPSVPRGSPLIVTPFLTLVDRAPCLYVPPPPPLVYVFRVFTIAVHPPLRWCNRVLWHSSNILWLQGRLPWNVTRICLS